MNVENIDFDNIVTPIKDDPKFRWQIDIDKIPKDMMLEEFIKAFEEYNKTKNIKLYDG